MKEPILLGIDGGNTKTDFFLFTISGVCLGHLRTGSCSHEALLGGFVDAEKVLKEGIEKVCEKAEILPKDISSSVLGLAGVDTRAQHEKLTDIAKHLLTGKILVCNDSMLGIMAAAPNGVGVCCINGTATSISGMDESGQRLQVGGIGHYSSDFAGGEFAAREVLRKVYSARYRGGESTMLTQGVLELFEVSEEANLMELFHPDCLVWDKKLELGLDRLLFHCARNKDAVAVSIVDDMARTLAESTAGCIKGLKFDEMVTIVLAGSLWVKCDYPLMQKKYCQEVAERVDQSCKFILLEEPPALGAILEAYRRLEQTQIPSEFYSKVACAMNNLQ